MNKKLSIVLMCGMVGFTGLAATSAAIAWFIPRASFNPGNSPIEGETESSYFAYGNGQVRVGDSTTNGPYGITKPRHLYNLAWLQYLGYFTEQTYFELADNIDMTGWTLPPIGTPANPFVGNFDGNGYVISNVTVSNQFSDYSGKHPGIVTESKFNDGDNPYTQAVESNNYPNIVGFFGIVGNLDDAYTGTYSSQVNEVKGFGLYKVNVKTVSSKSLIGVVAGYADATIENVAVDTSKVTINGSTKLDGEKYQHMSDFSIVGYTTKTKTVKKIDETIYDVNTKREEAPFNIADSGDAQGWGGSVNMFDLYNRLAKMRTNVADQSSGYTNYTRTGFNYRETYNSSPEHVETPTGSNQAGNNTLLTYYNTASRDYGTYSLYNRTVNSNTYDYLYLMGGQNKITTFEEYYQALKITDGPGEGHGHYLHSTNIRDGGAISNTNNSENAIGWVIPSKSTGYVYTIRNGNKYYLRVNGSSLVLESTQADATQFTREDLNSTNIRLVAGDSYLTYSSDAGNWVMADLPTPPGSIGVEPPYPEAPEYWSTSDYLSGGSQIIYTSDGTDYYVDKEYFNGGTTFEDQTRENSYIVTQTSMTDGYIFSNLTNGRKTTIKTTGNKYIRLDIDTQSNNCSEALKDALVVDTGTANNSWSVLSTGGKYAFTFSYSYREWFTTRTVYVYLGFNDGVIQAIQSQNSPTVNNLPSSAFFTIKTTASIVTEHNNVAQQIYDDAMDLHDAWVDSTETYVDDYNDYLRDINASYCINVSGGIENTEETFIDEYNPASDSMVYSGDNTTYIPLNVMKDGAFTSLANLEPKNSNTGYIVSGSIMDRNTSFDYDVSNIRIAKYPVKESSDPNSDTNYIGVSFSGDQIRSVYTVNENGFQSISENPNDTENYNPENSKYKKYYKSFKDFQNKLIESNGSVYGLHFTETSVSKDRLVVAPKVKISNFANADKSVKTYTNYELPVNSIDFNLADRGYINFFAGTYMNADPVQEISSFFSLHQVIRNSDHKILNIKEIQAVYSDGEDTHSYIFQYKDAPIKFSIPYVLKDGVRYNLTLNGEQDYSDSNIFEENSTMNASEYESYRAKFKYKLVFNTDWITNFAKDSNGNNQQLLHFIQRRLYYFEIPVNEGEFCLSSVEDGGYGAYLNYLDIGANASETQRTTVVEHIVKLENEYIYPIGMAFVDMPQETYAQGTGQYVSTKNPSTGQMVDRAIDVDDANSVCVSLNVGYSGDFIVERTSDNVTLIRASTSSAIPIYKGDGVASLKDNGVATELVCTPNASATYDIKRMTFCDYSAFLEDWTLTVITDVETDGVTTRNVVQYSHYGTDNQEVEYNYDNMFIYQTGTGERYVYDSTTGKFVVKGSTGDIELVIDNNDVDSTNVIFNYLLTQTGTDETSYFDIDYVIHFSEYLDSTKNMLYYDFKDYQIVIEPHGTEVYMTIVDVNGNKKIFVGEIDQQETNLITVELEGQTITIAVVPTPAP